MDKDDSKLDKLLQRLIDATNEKIKRGSLVQAKYGLETIQMVIEWRKAGLDKWLSNVEV